MTYFDENIQNQRFFYMNNYVRTKDTVVVQKMDKNVKLMWKATGIEPKGDYRHATVDEEVYAKWKSWLCENCHCSGGKTVETKNSVENEYPAVDLKDNEALKIWRTDRFGCERKRDSVLTDVVKILSDTMIEFSEVELFLGEFDSMEETENIKVGRYYFSSICYGGIITEQSAYCALEFWYHKNRGSYRVSMPCN